MGDLATVEFALVRLLLAIAHDALDGPADIDEWTDLWQDPGCFAPVLDYLEEHRDRFDLLHPVTPFFQTPGLHTAKSEVFSLGRIVADVPAGQPFFSAWLPDVKRLSFAEAARWLVHVHAYDTAGIKSGMVGDERVKGGKVYPLGTGWAGGLGGVFVEGETLRETLLLNLIAADTGVVESCPDDRPAWRHAPTGPGPCGRSASGRRDLYTWQSRRVLLHHDVDGVHGVVLGYGDPLTARNMHPFEPMTAWRRSLAQEKKLGQSPVYLPLEHDPARAAWRGVTALIADRLEETGGREGASRMRPRILEWTARLATERRLQRDYLVRARVVGVRYGTQQSVIDEVVEDRLPMPVVLLRRQEPAFVQQAIAAAEEADRAVRLLGDLAADVARAAGTEPEGPKAAALAQGFDALETPYRNWLTAMVRTSDPHEHRRVWQRQLRRSASGLAARLIAAAGDRAWEGRLYTDTKGTTHWLNSELAGLWFRGRLAKAVGDPGDSGDPPDRDPNPGSVGPPTPGPAGPSSGPVSSRPPTTDHAPTDRKVYP